MREQAVRLQNFLELLYKQLEAERAAERAEQPLHLQSDLERKHIVGLLKAFGITVNAEASIIYLELTKRPSPAVKGTLYHLQTVCGFKIVDPTRPFDKIDPWKL